MSGWIELHLLSKEQWIELIACIILIVLICGLYLVIGLEICRKHRSQKSTKSFLEDADVNKISNSRDFFKLEDEEQPNKCLHTI